MTSHLKSDLQGFAGTEKISNVASITGTTIKGTTVQATGALSGASLSATGAVSGGNVQATNYTKVGSKYVFYGSKTTSASVVEEASALVGAVEKKGSLYLGDGNVWVFKASNLASPLKY